MRRSVGGVAHTVPMTITVRPATSFPDVCTLLAPRNRDSTNCFCLSYRVPHQQNAAMRGPARFDFVENLMAASELPIGVLAYDGDTVVGWAAIAPRTHTTYDRGRTIPRLDDLDVWSLWCLRTRPGHRKQGITGRLIEGATRFAFEHGAPAVESYPVDSGGERIEPTMAYMGTVPMFEAAGYARAGETSSVITGRPRIIMRRYPD